MPVAPLPCLAVSVDNHEVAQLENFRLKVFRAAAEHLNFRKAAEHLFLTQPAVTLQIKALEDDLGVRLFDRAAGRVSLTRQGSLLLNYANQIATLVSQAEQELGVEDGKISGELSLGVSTTIAQYVLPRLLGAFLAEHPCLRLVRDLERGGVVHSRPATQPVMVAVFLALVGLAMATYLVSVPRLRESSS